jgi:16S rRNA (adenine1518-N6/adenine1519-N6)-dimethyltransferase
MTAASAPAPPAPPRARFRAIPRAETLRDVLTRHSIVPRRRLGQNFLHERRTARRIVDAAALRAGEHVLEIGPGLGALTLPLLAAGARVTAIEIDPRLADCLAAELRGREGFTLVRGDVLERDLDRLAPDARVLVANLPYSITGPVLARLIEGPDRFDRAVLMLQKEVGARLAARGGRELGAPAVLLRLLWRIERLFEVGTGAFVPPPEVVSVVVRLTRLPGATLDPGTREAVNRAYRQRRKMLRKTLSRTVAEETALARALAALGRPESARPEELAPEEWPRLLARARETSS